ncbi:hypothetical protein PVAP13_4KG060200 [Panicum virgatum]|uniref:Uncharacterized protein n=1 Tax=Panicum virgatum TaxID=38727 RepID=A0A8T0THL5_PANVG|nr:hypothetical protein PVAP13_4KG060200 [Panicum virgatum]
MNIVDTVYIISDSTSRLQRNSRERLPMQRPQLYYIYLVFSQKKNSRRAGKSRIISPESVMGLIFESAAGDPDAAALTAARKELTEALEALAARKERLEALDASARRIRDEFQTAADRVKRLSPGLLAGMRRLVEDPSADHSDLDEHLRGVQEATAQLGALFRAREAVDRDLAALQYEERLARGRVTAVGAAAELAAAMQSFAKLKRLLADIDASSGGVERATTTDQD